MSLSLVTYVVSYVIVICDSRSLAVRHASTYHVTGLAIETKNVMLCYVLTIPTDVCLLTSLQSVELKRV